MAKQLQELQQKVEELPAKQYAMIISLSILLLLRFVYIPWYQGLEEEQSQLSQLSSVVKSPSLMTAQLEQLKTELSGYEKNAAFWQDKFYIGNENQVKIEFANQVNNWVKQFDINMLRSKWGRVSNRQKERYTELQTQKYDITIRADYKNFLAFLAHLQQQQPLIYVNQISISRRATVGIATTTLSLTVLYKDN